MPQEGQAAGVTIATQFVYNRSYIAHCGRGFTELDEALQAYRCGNHSNIVLVVPLKMKLLRFSEFSDTVTMADSANFYGCQALVKSEFSDFALKADAWTDN
jgi:hypothetical protein